MLQTVAAFLRRLAGATTHISDQRVSQATRNWYTFQGVQMIVIGIISALAALLTWSTVMGAVWIGTIVATLWFVLNISFNYGQTQIVDAVRGKRFALPVIVFIGIFFSILVAAVNTNFLMLFSLDAEIRQNIEAKYQKERAAKEGQYVVVQRQYDQDLGKARLKLEMDADKVAQTTKADIAKLQADADRAKAAYTKAFAEHTAEVRGQGPSRLIGAGPRSKAAMQEVEALKAVMDDANKRLDDAKAGAAQTTSTAAADSRRTLEEEKSKLDARLAQQQDQIKRDITELDATPRYGFIDRDVAMWSLVDRDSHFLIGWFLLFMTIEASVLILKLASGKRDYHYLLESISIGHINAMGETIKSGMEVRRQRELAEAEAASAHTKALRKLRTDADFAALEDAVGIRQRIDVYLKALEGAATPEHIDAERERLNKLFAAQYGSRRRSWVPRVVSG